MIQDRVPDWDTIGLAVKSISTHTKTVARLACQSTTAGSVVTMTRQSTAQPAHLIQTYSSLAASTTAEVTARSQVTQPTRPQTAPKQIIVRDPVPTRPSTKPKSKTVGTKVKITAEEDAKDTINKLGARGRNLPVEVDAAKTKLTPNGTVVVITKSKEEAEKLKMELSGQFKVAIETKSMPKVKVSRVPLFITDEEVEGQLGGGSKVISSRNFLNSRTKDIIAVTPTEWYYKLLADKSLTFGNFITCKIFPCNTAPQCGICLKEHATEKCLHKEDGPQAIRCSHCAEKGHRWIDCPSRDSLPKCGNCLDTKLKEINHHAFDRNCPIKTRANRRLAQRTEWEVDLTTPNHGPGKQ